MTIDSNGITGVIARLFVVALFGFAMAFPVPKFLRMKAFWKAALFLTAGYLVFFYAFR